MAAPSDIVPRDTQGRFSSNKKKKGRPSLKKNEGSVKEHIIIDHNYSIGHFHDHNEDSCDLCCPGFSSLRSSSKIKTKDWKMGRRVVEWATLLNDLQSCTHCRLGPLLFTPQHVKAEMKMGLGGYLFILCCHCGFINRVAYGSTYTEDNRRGQRNFTVNTKLGAAMIDTLGGPQRVNNFLTTLDLPYISHKNLKVMERRAGHIIENFAEKSMANARKTAFEKEMSDISCLEEDMAPFVTDVSYDKELGLAVLEGEFQGDPSILGHVCQDVEFTKENRDGSEERDSELSCLEEGKTPFVNDVTHVTYDQELGSTVMEDEFQGITTTSVCQDHEDGELVTKNKDGSEGGESNRNSRAQLGDADSVSTCQLSSFETPPRSTSFSYFKQGRHQRKFRSANTPTITSKRNLKYMPTSRSGMTVCADHGWQKKGFDSLTGIQGSWTISRTLYREVCQ